MEKDNIWILQLFQFSDGRIKEQKYNNNFRNQDRRSIEQQQVCKKRKPLKWAIIIKKDQNSINRMSRCILSLIAF